MEGFDDKIMDLVWDQARDTAKEEFFGMLIGDWDKDVNVLLGQLRAKMGDNADSLVYFLFAELIKENRVRFSCDTYNDTKEYDMYDEPSAEFNSIPVCLGVEGMDIEMVSKNKEAKKILYTTLRLEDKPC